MHSSVGLERFIQRCGRSEFVTNWRIPELNGQDIWGPLEPGDLVQIRHLSSSKSAKHDGKAGRIVTTENIDTRRIGVRVFNYVPDLNVHVHNVWLIAPLAEPCPRHLQIPQRIETDTLTKKVRMAIPQWVEYMTAHV